MTTMKRRKTLKIASGIVIVLILAWHIPLPAVSVAQNSREELCYCSVISGETDIRKVKQVLDCYSERNYVFAGMLWIKRQLLLDKELLWNYCTKAGLPYYTSDGDTILKQKECAEPAIFGGGSGEAEPPPSVASPPAP